MIKFSEQLSKDCNNKNPEEIRLILSDGFSTYVGQPVVVQYDTIKLRCNFICGSKNVDCDIKYLRDCRWDIINRCAEILEESVTGRKIGN